MSLDKSELIVRKLAEFLKEEAVQEGSVIHGFRIYDKIPRRDPLFYPCIVVLRGSEETVEEYLGGGSMTGFNVTIQLAILEKNALTDDVDVFEDELMLVKFRDFLDEFFDASILRIDEINLGISGAAFTLRIPGPESPVFGVEMVVQMTYEDD